MKILVIGLGIGSLYKKVLEDRYEVFTVDVNLDKGADFISLKEALEAHRYYLAIICTPNFLHEEIAWKLDGKVPKILVEKPGFESEKNWSNFLNRGTSKLIMVKNNIYRPELEYIKDEIANDLSSIDRVNICWINKDRIPNPGSWFTNKEKSFGGVERDLVPHLLSIYYKISSNNSCKPEDIELFQFHDLKSVHSTEYGSIEAGIYDVSDYCSFYLDPNFKVIADWKSTLSNKIGVEIIFTNKNSIFHEFGLCPEEEYGKMVDEILNMTDEKYEEHNKIDLFIHKTVDQLYV